MPFAAALLFAAAAFAAERICETLCRTIVPFADGPRPGTPPRLALVLAAAGVGAALALRGASIEQSIVACLLTSSLVACCCSDIACGVVPDRFTLLPLAAVLAAAAIARDARPVISALFVLVPFALAAYLSGGRGLGWGDVKLVTLAGAVLGVQTSVIAFSCACLLAAGTALVLRRRHEPIAFVPYLAGSAALALALPHLP